MDYKTESDLQADGFVLTPNVFHGKGGNGKVYEKIVHTVDADASRVYYSVDTDGSVALYTKNYAEVTQSTDTSVSPVAETNAEDTTVAEADPVKASEAGD